MMVQDSKNWHFREKAHTPNFKALWKHVSTKGNPSGFYLFMVERENAVRKDDQEEQTKLAVGDDRNIELILIRSKPKEKSEERLIEELKDRNEALEKAKDWMDEYIYIKNLEESL